MTTKRKTITVKSKAQNKLAKQKVKFLEYYGKLPIQKLAASSIGKDEDTIIRWKNADADFADQTQVAKAEWALAKSKEVKSVEWLLERVMKDHFSQKIEEEHSVNAELEEALERIANLLPK